MNGIPSLMLAMESALNIYIYPWVYRDIFAINLT